MASLTIPMIVLAHHFKRARQVPAVNPNYRSALSSYLGKDHTPAAFNTNILLEKGVHLHFILPSALKKGTEVTGTDGQQTFDYPAVPDRYLVTRMYVHNGKIKTARSIVESNFYSLDSTYNKSITIPKFDDLRARHRFRYMGRTYSASAPCPAPVGESGYFDKITAVGAGDPLFSAYYPSCMSVFGFYDNLDNVPSDAVLTYFVTGYYSNPENDILNGVKSAEDMKKVMGQYKFSVEEYADRNIICNSCVLFGEVGGIELARETPPPQGQINIGIGKSSAEALSAIIKGVYYEKQPEMERFLTSVQYDTADEVTQPDGNFKVDDDIHSRGFSVLSPVENAYLLNLPKEGAGGGLDQLTEQYSDLILAEQEIGRLRRSLEYQKNSLYYLWEFYEGQERSKKEQVKPYLDHTMSELTALRSTILEKMSEMQKAKKEIEASLLAANGELQLTSAEPFALANDPVVMLFGEGMNRTYAFGEEGRFEKDDTLFCLTAPLTCEIPSEQLLAYFENPNDCCLPGYDPYDAVTALLLDRVNLLPRLNISPLPVIKEKYSPVMFNEKPMEQVTLLLQWESVFRPDYSGSNPEKSRLEYGDTDYTYSGTMSQTAVTCEGMTVLTPHGVCQLQEKLIKYLTYHSDSPEIVKLADKIKDIAAVSQSLGGFQISLAALQYAFQYPIDIDQNDPYSQKIARCISPGQPLFWEPPAERLAVRSNTQLFPLREGFFGLSKLAITTSFGVQRKLIDDELTFKGTRYFSENVKPVLGENCFFPLALTSAARLLTGFVTAENNKVLSSQLPGATPVIGIFMPDMLNRNLNIFTNTGISIGTLKTAYRIREGKKVPVGRFVPSPNVPAVIDERITKLISSLTKEDTAFAELMEVIDRKLNATLPFAQNNFIFGRALVLAELSVRFEFFGSPEWSKMDADIGREDTLGLREQAFPVMFGDKERVTDGVCCGFYDELESGFPPFGIQLPHSKYLCADPFRVKAAEDAKNVTLLFDPMLKVTISTGFLPVKQVELFSEHTDFSKYQLLSAELNSVLSGEGRAELPDFGGGAVFDRFYPVLKDRLVTYHKLDIVPPSSAIPDQTIITDGMVTKQPESHHAGEGG